MRWVGFVSYNEIASLSNIVMPSACPKDNWPRRALRVQGGHLDVDF